MSAVYDPTVKPIEAESARHVGPRLMLRPLTAADLSPAYLGWFADPVVTKFLPARTLSAAAALARWEQERRTADSHAYAICAADDGRLLGEAKIGAIRWAHGFADLSVVVGEPSRWGRGLGGEATALAARIAFATYGLRKLTTYVHGDNVAALKAYARGGFVQESLFAGHHLIDGQPQDVHSLSAFNPAYFADSTFAAALAGLGLPPL